MTDSFVITYQGGAAGDMFASGANGIAIDLQQHEYIRRAPYTIKPMEPEIMAGKLDLECVINDLPYKFVTTHIYDSWKFLKFPTVSIVVTDPDVIELIILRQMKLQKLTLKVAPNETFYRLIKSFVQKKDWIGAAKTWFAMAHKKWLVDQQHRVNNALPNTMILNFNKLFCDDFVHSIEQQRFTENLDVIKKNHNIWLMRNGNDTLDSTLESMASKIQKMDWSLQQGSVTYDQS